MKTPRQPSSKRAEHLDILSSIWILACNDAKPLITFDGIKHRLGLGDDVNVAELVRAHGELFRFGMPSSQLKAWQEEMLRNEHIPSHIRAIENPEARREAIQRLAVSDGFRSQFRGRGSAERSPIEVISWGLEHIERIRNAEVEKKGQMRSVFKDIWIPLLSAITAIAAIISSAHVQSASMKQQAESTRYQTTILAKYKAFSELMSKIDLAYNTSTHGEHSEVGQELLEVDRLYTYLRPFVAEAQRDLIRKDLDDVEEAIRSVASESALVSESKKTKNGDEEKKHDGLRSRSMDAFTQKRDTIAKKLEKPLFTE